MRFEPLEARTLLSVNVLGYHYDNASTGQNPNETDLTPGNVNVNTFGKLFSAPIDGQAYASPLYMEDVNMTVGSMGVHNVVYSATENDSLYAIDADTGAQLWMDSFLAPGPGVTSVVPVPVADVQNASITPTIGITSTPVIDPATNTLYLTAETKEVVGTDTHYIHRLHAVDVTSGNEMFGGPVVIGDMICNDPTDAAPTFTYVSGPVINGAGDGGATVQFNALRQLQRPALTLVNGNIYIGFGSIGDMVPYYGWLLSYNAQTLALDGVFNAAPNGGAPNGGQSAIWQSGGRIAADANGALYMQTGNGAFDTTLNAAGFPIFGDYGDSFVKVVVDPTTNSAHMNQNGWGLKVADYFTQSNQEELNRIDFDVGSGAPLLLPDSVGSDQDRHLLVGSGKDGTIFLIDRDNMGHFDPTTNHVVQELDGALLSSFDTPAYFNNTIYFVETPYSYTDPPGLAKSFSISNATMSTTPATISAAADNYSYPGSTPIVSADGNTNGVVWTINNSPAQLRAYDANSFATLLYTSAQAAGDRDALGSAVKFAPPVEANGMVYVGTSNAVVGYGLLPSQLATATGYLFYHNSARYDTTGNPQTPLPFSDDNAIATDKSAYLPGSGAATSANVSSYVKGINGVMVDLSGGGAHTSITLANILNDFTFKVGNDNSPGGWSAAPLPTAVMVRPRAGVSGSGRVELIWADAAITQKWLEVTVLADANTGLTTNDVFFFGSEICDTGADNTATIFKVGTQDTTGTQTHLATLGTNQPITNVYDFNRDGQVGAADITLGQTHGTTNSTGLVAINIASDGPFAALPLNGGGDGDNGGANIGIVELTWSALGSQTNVSALVTTAANTNTSSSGPPIPAWIANRLSQLDLNSGRLATYFYFEHLSQENTASSRAILAQADQAADSLNLDDELLDGLLVGLKLE